MCRRVHYYSLTGSLAHRLEQAGVVYKGLYSAAERFYRIWLYHQTFKAWTDKISAAGDCGRYQRTSARGGLQHSAWETLAAAAGKQSDVMILPDLANV